MRDLRVSTGPESHKLSYRGTTTWNSSGGPLGASTSNLLGPTRKNLCHRIESLRRCTSREIARDIFRVNMISSSAGIVLILHVVLVRSGRGCDHRLLSMAQRRLGIRTDRAADVRDCAAQLNPT